MRSESSKMKGPADLCDDHDNRSNNSCKTPGSDRIDRSIDFSEYMWMGEELEEFDRKVQQELMEQEFIDACFEQMMAEEENQQQLQWFYPQEARPQENQMQITNQLQHMNLTGQTTTTAPTNVLNSKLNPNAPVFVPRAKVADR